MTINISAKVNTYNREIDRYKKAVETARAMSKAKTLDDVPVETLDAYIADYFDTVPTRSLRIIDEEAWQEWQNNPASMPTRHWN
ncbi:MAG: hypothetical protein KGQ41_01280 [Alphaproteobacteria bacterium]|nr:hypothetical protein [Alphaproteobacteria bacterium]